MELLEFRNAISGKQMTFNMVEQVLNRIESPTDRLIAKAYYSFEEGHYENAASDLLQVSSFIEPDEFANKVRIMFSFDDCVEYALCSCAGCEAGTAVAPCCGGPCACICGIVLLNAFCGCDINCYTCTGACCDSDCCRNCCNDCLNSYGAV